MLVSYYTSNFVGVGSLPLTTMVSDHVSVGVITIYILFYSYIFYGFGGKAYLVMHLPCMQIVVIWAQASWPSSNTKHLRPKHET